MLAKAMSPLPPQGNLHLGYKTSSYNMKRQSTFSTHKALDSNCCNQCKLEQLGKNCPSYDTKEDHLGLAPCANRRAIGGGTVPNFEGSWELLSQQ